MRLEERINGVDKISVNNSKENFLQTTTTGCHLFKMADRVNTELHKT